MSVRRTDGRRRRRRVGVVVEGLEGRALMASGPTPNLAVLQVSNNGVTSVMAGLTVPVSAVIATEKLRGANYQVGYYLSTDDQFSASKDRLIQTATFQNFAGGGSRDVKVPADVKAGTYFIFVVADPKGKIAETNEKDNALATTAVTVTGAQADLAAKVQYGGVNRLVGGAIIKPKVTVSNVGTTSAKGTAQVSFYLVDALRTDVSGLTPLNPVPIPMGVNLARGKSKTDDVRFELPSGVNAQGTVLEAVVTLPGLSEVRTDNNAAVTAGTVSLGDPFVDLKAAFAGTVPATLAGGKKNSVKVKVTNTGNATVKADVVVQLGVQPAGGAATFFAGSKDKEDLKPGESTTVTLSLPAGQSGTQFLLARVTYEGDQNPSNDVAVSASPVTFT